ncbi:hypothetical protein CCHL11_06606 [Colletotrichum chlorophyti]|uniref:Rhodopsin domain-containing protein n=1 Tax=Colletotrichum chlorophyti TaxID=708187 RepID=A0A1Q8RXR8_9PEZI|nr:hypothetical protein CCHL11_06606 [Colletotrichum chlorophyti]
MSSGNGTAPPPLDPSWAAESNTARIMAIVTVFHFLALTSVGLRVYARVWVIRSPGWDDLTIIFSALCALGGWVVFVIQANYGLGKHLVTIDKQYDYVVYQHASFWQSVISAGAALMWLKVSIALNLLRLTVSNWYKWALWATIALTLVYCIGGMFPFFFHCQPMSGYWDKSIKPKCRGGDELNKFGVVNTGLNILTDIILAVLPVPMVWNLQMKRRVRIYVIGILSMGYFAVAMGIIKAYHQCVAINDRDKTFNQSVQFWGFLQLQVGIIAACAPTLKPLFSRLLRLSSHENTPDIYGSQSRSNWKFARTLKYSTMCSRSHNETLVESDRYELNQRSGIYDGEHHNISNAKAETTATATSQGRNPDDETGAGGSGLPGGGTVHIKGIIRTTEVTVE